MPIDWWMGRKEKKEMITYEMALDFLEMVLRDTEEGYEPEFTEVER